MEASEAEAEVLKSSPACCMREVLLRGWAGAGFVLRKMMPRSMVLARVDV